MVDEDVEKTGDCQKLPEHCNNDKTMLWLQEDSSHISPEWVLLLVERRIERDININSKTYLVDLVPNLKFMLKSFSEADYTEALKKFEFKVGAFQDTLHSIFFVLPEEVRSVSLLDFSTRYHLGWTWPFLQRRCWRPSRLLCPAPLLLRSKTPRTTRRKVVALKTKEMKQIPPGLKYVDAILLYSPESIAKNHLHVPYKQATTLPCYHF